MAERGGGYFNMTYMMLVTDAFLNLLVALQESLDTNLRRGRDSNSLALCCFSLSDVEFCSPPRAAASQ